MNGVNDPVGQLADMSIAELRALKKALLAREGELEEVLRSAHRVVDTQLWIKRQRIFGHLRLKNRQLGEVARSDGEPANVVSLTVPTSQQNGPMLEGSCGVSI